jgi:hypothetical protein
VIAALGLIHQANSFAVGSGSVAIPEYMNYPKLGQPITDDPIHSGPIFEASWTHALHCVCEPVHLHSFIPLSNIDSGHSYTTPLIRTISWYSMALLDSMGQGTIIMPLTASNIFETKFSAWPT